MNDAMLFPDEAAETSDKAAVPMVREETALTSDGFISMVLSMPAGAEDRVQLLERLIAMKNGEADRNARLEFERKFAAMQKELPEIKPDKTVKRRNGGKMYDYASLPYIKSIVDPIAQRYGFSYHWSQADSKDGKMRTIFHLCNAGHERQNYFESGMLGTIKSGGGDEVTNVVQAARGTESYQKRATFIDGFGLTILGEDTDARIDLDDDTVADLDKIRNAKTTAELMDNYQVIYKKYEQDRAKLALVVGEYNIAKQVLIKVAPK